MDWRPTNGMSSKGPFGCGGNFYRGEVKKAGGGSMSKGEPNSIREQSQVRPVMGSSMWAASPYPLSDHPLPPCLKGGSTSYSHSLLVDCATGAAAAAAASG